MRGRMRAACTASILLAALLHGAPCAAFCVGRVARRLPVNGRCVPTTERPPRARRCAPALAARKKRDGGKGGWGGDMTVGREPLQPGLRERSICVGGEEFTVVELEKTTDLVDDWIQNQMATEDPFGVVLWPAAQCIATNLLHDPPAGGAGGTGPVDSLDWLNGRRVVELGAGTGLCSLVAARAGAKVLTTDTNTLTLDLVALAARRQELEVRVLCTHVNALRTPAGSRKPT